MLEDAAATTESHDDEDDGVVVETTSKDTVRDATPYEKSLKTQLRKLRAQTNEFSGKLTAAEAKAVAAEAKLAAELERIQGEHKTAVETAVAAERHANNSRVITAEIKALALKEGIRDPAAIKMLDLKDVTLGEDGNLVLPDKYFENAKKAMPYLFGEAPKYSPATGYNANPQSSPAPAAGNPGVDIRKAKEPEFKAALASRFGIIL